MNAEQFAMRVASITTGSSLDEIESAYAKATNPRGVEESVVGIDPLTILAIISAIIQVMELLNKHCKKPQLFSENSRIRNPFMLAIFKARVLFAAKRVGYEGNASELADAMLDVAHSSGEKAVSEVLSDLDSY